MASALARHGVAVAFYALLLVASLAPQSLRPWDTVAYVGDSLDTVYFMAWNAHQLFREPLHLFDANILYPHREAMTLAGHRILPGVLAAPLIALSGNPILAYNAVLALAYLLAAMAGRRLAGLLGIDPIGAWLARLSDFTPYLFVIAAFSFLYKIIPNARVHLRPAFVGGIFAGITWVAGGRLFADFVVSASSYTAIYAGFAILFFLMLWMYLSWLILLIGAQLAFYLQHPEYLRHGQGTPTMSNGLRERLALSTMLLVGRDFEAPSHGWRPESLAVQMRVPRHFLEPVIGALKEEGLLTDTHEQRLMPARDPRRILLTDVLGAVRSEARDRAREKGQSWNTTVELLTQRIEGSIATALDGKTLADLVDRDLAETAQALAREDSKVILATSSPAKR